MFSKLLFVTFFASANLVVLPAATVIALNNLNSNALSRNAVASPDVTRPAAQPENARAAS